VVQPVRRRGDSSATAIVALAATVAVRTTGPRSAGPANNSTKSAIVTPPTHGPGSHGFAAPPAVFPGLPTVFPGPSGPHR
jgi:hypothetical protein